MISCFPPIVDKNSRLLILGTIPGEESLMKGQYYGNNRNHFWDIIVRIVDPHWNPFHLASEILDWNQRKELLQKYNIALWDVIKCCEREGSSDKKITNETLNDIPSFLNQHPSISLIVFNGLKAYQLAAKQWGAQPFSLKTEILNSTSTLNPNNTFSILKEWKQRLKPS